jgi:Calcineurin-like phosphoesterase
MTDTIPRRVMVIGDLHHNTAAAVEAITRGAPYLRDEDLKLALQLGDFGYWGQDSYLSKTDAALRKAGMKLWFLDGNHEHHDRLSRLLRDSALPDPVDVSPQIRWLPRGSRWTWHGRVWMAMGGAVSVDKAARRQGLDWFPQEEISAEQAQKAAAAGHTDVMITHDCPSDVSLTLPPPPAMWLPQIPRAEYHRERLQQIVDAVQLSFLMHGHYHCWYEKTVQMKHGPVRVTGLDMDGEPGNWMILNTVTMEWEVSD